MSPALTAAVPVLPVHDTHKAALFYRDRLGFAVDHVDAGYAIVVRDRVAIHLWAATDESWRERAGDRPVVSGAETFIAGTASCRVHVTDTDALCARYREAGVLHPNGDLSDKPHGLREFAILDLDGNLITFFERIA
ncbi:MAG: VOC family protein [Roseitalea porphyridii]|uniref:bleomycin resistance protein n=1 Tax=Roseitalea porphyridii TaxID=1852022 RepID=UPI0032D8D7E4